MKYQLISLSVISILILSGCNLTSFLESENKSSTVQQVDEILLEAPLHSYPPVPLAASAFTALRKPFAEEAANSSSFSKKPPA